MTSAVLDRTDADLQALFDNEAACLYTRSHFRSGEITFKCDQPAHWAGICRRCGFVTLLCNEHYYHLNGYSPTGAGIMRCTECHTESRDFSELYFLVHKI